MYYLAAATLLCSVFFFIIIFFLDKLIFLPVPSSLAPDWFFSLLPSTPSSFQLNQGLTAPWRKKKKQQKTCHFIFQYNQERMCPAPICPFGGNIAMLQRFNCANRVGGSQRQCQDLELRDNKTSMVYLFFIQLDKISIFWLTTDNFHFRKSVFWSLNVLFFSFSNYWWLLKRTAQTVTLLEKSGIVWSHTGLETFQRRNRKGLWERNKRMCPPQPELSPLKSKNCTIDTFHTPLLCFLLDVCLEGVVSVLQQEIPFVYSKPSLRELLHPPF